MYVLAHSIKGTQSLQTFNSHVMVSFDCLTVLEQGEAPPHWLEKAVCWWKHPREQRAGAARHTDISQSSLNGWDCPQPNLSTVREEERGRGGKIIKVIKLWEYVCWFNSYVSMFGSVFRCIYLKILCAYCVLVGLCTSVRALQKGRYDSAPPPSSAQQCSVRSQNP